VIPDKIIGRYASQSGVNNDLNKPDENYKSPADGNVSDVNGCQHACCGEIGDENVDPGKLAAATFSTGPFDVSTQFIRISRYCLILIILNLLTLDG
jgi:hypothetical protein